MVHTHSSSSVSVVYPGTVCGGALKSNGDYLDGIHVGQLDLTLINVVKVCHLMSLLRCALRPADMPS